jgi:phosphoribosyl-AMP cyclohydrolase
MPQSEPADPQARFAQRTSALDIESGTIFAPKFDGDGLIPAIVTDAGSGEVLMFAYMDAEALSLSLTTRLAHFYSRSRKQLWQKGEQSGNRMDVIELLTDCDQDVLWLKVKVAGSGVACHTGRRSCFYRALPLGEAPSQQMRLERL